MEDLKKRPETRDIIKHLEERNSNNLFCRINGVDYWFSRDVFPIANGGTMEVSFQDITTKERRHYLETNELPMEVVYRMLMKIGFPKIYMEPVQTDLWEVCESDIVDYVKKLVQGLKKGFILLGNVGTGKTMALRYAAEHLLTYTRSSVKPSDLAFVTHTQFADAMFDRNQKPILLKRLKDVQYLLFDDLGRSYDHKYPISFLDDLFCHRQENMLTTCVTTNLTPKQIEGLGEYSRIYSRLKHRRWMQTPLTLARDDLRGANNG